MEFIIKGSFLCDLRYIAQQFTGNIVKTDHAINIIGKVGRSLLPMEILKKEMLKCWTILIVVTNKIRITNPNKTTCLNVLLKRISSSSYFLML